MNPHYLVLPILPGLDRKLVYPSATGPSFLVSDDYHNIPYGALSEPRYRAEDADFSLAMIWISNTETHRKESGFDEGFSAIIGQHLKKQLLEITDPRQDHVIAASLLKAFQRLFPSITSRLSELLLEEYPDDDFTPVDPHTVIRAFRLFLRLSSHGDIPRVVASGDGGIDLEWETDERFISVHLSPSDERFDRIYIENAQGYQNVPLAQTDLDQLLSNA